MTEADPRYTACELLNALDSGKTTLDHLISENYDPVFQKMARRDRNFTYALVYGVLRTRGRLDWIVSRFSKNGLGKIDPGVLNIFRVALYQVFFMSRVPESAAVNTAVEIAKKGHPRWVVRFVNGLLRNVLRNRDTIAWPDKTADPLLWLSVEASFPRWLLERWTDRFGFEQTGALCRFFNTIPPLTMRANTLKATRDDLMAAILPSAEKVLPAPYSPDGIQVYGLNASVGELDAFKDGLFQVQDEAAQMVSHVVDPQPGESVLDACAGLGGKTGHLAQLMENTGTLIAMDNHAKRLEKLEAEMRRLGVSIAGVLHHDLKVRLAPEHISAYDRVLIDAPCSGTGVIRRNPDTRWSLKSGDFARYRDNQLRYLENVSSAVKPGGVLVYAVCTIEPEETDAVVDAFLKNHPGYAALPLTGIAGRFPAAPEAPGRVRSIPHEHEMDGFFIAAFKKTTS